MELDLTADYIDVRDIIARVEALRDERAEMDDEQAWNERTDEGGELASLESILADMAGNGGDEQWEGDWYPVTLIRDSYFEDYMDELLEDIGELKRFEDRPSYITITIDYDALQMDYTSVEIEGEIYWYR